MPEEQNQSMAKRKNIYVDDEAYPTLEKFEAAGGNASELFKKALAKWEEEEERRKDLGEYERIVIDMYDHERNDVVSRKAFTGRWLLCPDDRETRTSPGAHWDAGAYWGVAETKKGRIAVVVNHCNEGFSTDLKVYENVDEFKATEDVPEDIKAAALTALGEDYPEELDI